MPAPLQQPAGRHSILPLFPLLASHNPSTRLDAAFHLVHALPQPQGPAQTNDADTPYALKRLVAGLASSNDAARQGFAVALTQLVALLPADSPQARNILAQVFDQTTPKQGADPREERDLYFARLMGLHALVRSGVLVRPGPDSTQDRWQECLGGLVSLANKKTWIREPSYWVVCDALQALCDAPDSLEWKHAAVEWALQRLVGDSREKARAFSPEKVAVVLVLQANNVDADWPALLAPTFPSGSVLARSSLSALASALRGSSSSSSADGGASMPKQGSNAVKTSKGAPAPAAGQAPHFVWTLLADAYFPPSSSTAAAAAAKTERAPFSAFWTACVDRSLFASSSLPLKALGFSLITLFLPRVAPADVASLLSPHALRVLANHLRREMSGSGGEKTLLRVADKLVTSTLPAYFAAADANRAAALATLKRLVAAPDSQYNAFDTKVLERIVVKLDVAGVRGWVAHLRGVFLAPTVDDAAASANGDDADNVKQEAGNDNALVEDAEARDKRLTAQRNWALDQLLFVVRNASVAKDDDVVTALLEFLAVVGWFDITSEATKGARSYVPSSPLTPAHRTATRTRFFSILASLVSAPAPLGGPAWLHRALALLDNLAADTKHFARSATSVSAEDDDEDDEDEAEGAAYDARLRELYPQLGGAEGPRPAARALVEGVRLVAWDEGRDDAADVLEGAVDAVEALFPALSASTDEDDDQDEDDDKPEPATVVVDVLLALLRRPSAFVKAFAGPVVLKGLAEDVGLQAVELLRDVVAPEEDEVEEEEQQDGEGEAAADKKASKKAAAAAASDESDDDGASSSGSDSDSDDEGGFEVDEAFKNELLAALEAGGMGVPGDDEPMRDGGDESDDEELLDDEAMLELDDKLADIFRANGGGRKSKKRDRQDDLHYRLRVLDLLDVLAHTKAASALLIPLYVPLFNLIRTASSAVESELQAKAGKLLRFLVQPRKSADAAALVEPSDESSHAALEALDDLHRAAAACDAPALAPLCAQVAVALTKAAVALAPASSRTHALEHVARVMVQSFEAYLTTKNAKTRVQPQLTAEVCKRAPGAAWGVLPRVLELAKGDGGKVNAFRRMQAFEVAQSLVTSYAASLKTPESKSAVLTAMPAYRSALFTALSTSLTSSSSAAAEFDAARLKLLAKQALASARLAVSLSSQADAAKAWHPQEWSGLVAEAAKSDRFKGAVGVTTLVKQLVGVLGATVADDKAASKKDKKRKAGEVQASSSSAAAKEHQGTPAKKAKASPAKGTPSSAAAAAASPAASKGKKASAAPAAPVVANGESEVQDESVEVDAAGDDSMVLDGAEAAGGAGDGSTPSKKGKKDKKDKKRRRESAGNA